jgi:hypothetical protein
MAYNALTDFIALLRLTGGGVRSERMPGLDYVVAALNRMGLFAVTVSQTAPVVNQATTVWVQPALPSWSAEATIWLWNAGLVIPAYAQATPALWTAFLSGIRSGYLFQSVAVANANIVAGTTLCAVQRVAPVATGLVLPVLGAQWVKGVSLRIADFSAGVVNHTITLTTPDGSTIMGRANWALLSTADNLSSVELYPSPDLNAWVLT